jgi:hypothetical protein
VCGHNVVKKYNSMNIKRTNKRINRFSGLAQGFQLFCRLGSMAPLEGTKCKALQQLCASCFGVGWFDPCRGHQLDRFAGFSVQAKALISLRCFADFSPFSLWRMIVSVSVSCSFVCLFVMPVTGNTTRFFLKKREPIDHLSWSMPKKESGWCGRRTICAARATYAERTSSLKTVGGGVDCGLRSGGAGKLQRQVSGSALLALAVGVVGSRWFSVLCRHGVWTASSLLVLQRKDGCHPSTEQKLSLAPVGASNNDILWCRIPCWGRCCGICVWPLEFLWKIGFVVSVVGRWIC